MKNARMVTVYEIAERVGVSASTVSRALNRRGLVRPELERKIEAVAEMMGYSPDLVARGLRAKHMQWLGLVVDHIDQPWAAQISGAISRAAAAAGWSIILLARGQDPKSERDIIQRLASLRAGAIIQIDSPLDPDVELAVPGQKIITIGFGAPGNRSNRVGSDEEAGAAAAAGHLLTLGHRRIGHLAGRPSWPGTAEQINGFRDAVTRGGNELDPSYIAAGDWSLESGYRQATHLITNGVTALFAATDQQAAGAIDALHELGRRVPREVAVVGHDDSLICHYVRPRLTSVALPLRDMAEAAVRLALDCIERDVRDIPSVTVATRLVIRESCGGVPAQDSNRERM